MRACDMRLLCHLISYMVSRVDNFGACEVDTMVDRSGRKAHGAYLHEHNGHEKGRGDCPRHFLTSGCLSQEASELVRTALTWGEEKGTYWGVPQELSEEEHG